jgi:hypothetical protein
MKRATEGGASPARVSDNRHPARPRHDGQYRSFAVGEAQRTGLGAAVSLSSVRSIRADSAHAVLEREGVCGIVEEGKSWKVGKCRGFEHVG